MQNTFKCSQPNIILHQLGYLEKRTNQHHLTYTKPAKGSLAPMYEPSFLPTRTNYARSLNKLKILIQVVHFSSKRKQHCIKSNFGLGRMDILAARVVTVALGWSTGRPSRAAACGCAPMCPQRPNSSCQAWGYGQRRTVRPQCALL